MWGNTIPASKWVIMPNNKKINESFSLNKNFIYNFMASILQHVDNITQHTRYYGAYSNVVRGRRRAEGKKSNPKSEGIDRSEFKIKWRDNVMKKVIVIILTLLINISLSHATFFERKFTYGLHIGYKTYRIIEGIPIEYYYSTTNLASGAIGSGTMYTANEINCPYTIGISGQYNYKTLGIGVIYEGNLLENKAGTGGSRAAFNEYSISTYHIYKSHSGGIFLNKYLKSGYLGLGVDISYLYFDHQIEIDYGEEYIEEIEHPANLPFKRITFLPSASLGLIFFKSEIIKWLVNFKYMYNGNYSGLLISTGLLY